MTGAESLTGAWAGRQRILVAAALVAVTGLLVGCQPTPGGGVNAPGSSAEAYPLLTSDIAEVEAGPTPQAQASLADNALAVLDTIPVQRKTEWDGPFDRVASFGEGWADLDGDGCNTRQEMLAEGLGDTKLNRDQCRVDTGVLYDPYTGETVPFTRGANTSDRVQIDHVVALYNAWRTGAQDLSFEERVALANDPLNLQPTVDWANDEKESKDASQWLPPNGAYHCTYVARQIAVKATYQLWVTPAEDDAMREVLATCQ